ncbi:hypothetical protein D3C76_1814090 [compost metagenome]
MSCPRLRLPEGSGCAGIFSLGERRFRSELPEQRRAGHDQLQRNQLVRMAGDPFTVARMEDGKQ